MEDGNIPKDAWRADDGDKKLYVGRAEHGGRWNPGTVYPDLGLAHVPWGGKNYEKSEYQVSRLYNPVSQSLQSLDQTHLNPLLRLEVIS